MATVAENLQTIIDIKADIKTAIEKKGVTVGDASFSEYAGKIDSIEGSGTTTWTLSGNVKFADGDYTLTELHFDNLTNCAKMFYECRSLTSIPLFDTSNVTSMFSMFDGCEKLTTVPEFNTSNVTNMGYMFNGCSRLTTVPLFNTSNVIDMNFMFYNCSNLTSLPLFNTSSCEDIQYAFYNVGVTTLPKFDTSKVKYIRGFIGSSDIVTLPELDFGSVIAENGDVYYLFDSCYNLTNVGGFKDLGKSFYIKNYPANLNFTSCSNLSYESCLNIFNSIYNLTTTYTRTAKIVFNSTTYALLSADDIAIATNKGWVVESA